MGVDMLDFTFRIEKRFEIKINRDDYRIVEEWATERRPKSRPHDLTAGELHDWVVKLCEARGIIVPYSSWNRVKVELSKTVGKRPQVVHR